MIKILSKLLFFISLLVPATASAHGWSGGDFLLVLIFYIALPIGLPVALIVFLVKEAKKNNSNNKNDSRN